jgi:hypothetical protein
MNETKESEKLAAKLTVRDTFEISTKDVQEFDSLLIEIKKKQEQFPQFSMDIVCEWDTMEVHIGPVDGNDKRQLKIKNLRSDQWNMFVNRVRRIEDQIITYLNEGKPEDEEKTIPVFSCNVKLRMEMKDKEAQKALESPEQLSLFTPVGDLAQSYFREKKLIDEAIDLREKIREIETSQPSVITAYKELNKFMEEHDPDEERITYTQEYAKVHTSGEATLQ